MQIHSIVHRQPGANMVSEKTWQGLVLINMVSWCGVPNKQGQLLMYSAKAHS
jgi:hypothetical protein